MIPLMDRLGTAALGSARPLQTIQQVIAARFEVELPLYRVDEVVRSGKLLLGEEEVALPDGWDVALETNGQDIAVRLQEAWGNGREFDRILIAGGGSEIPQVVAAIKAKFPNTKVVPEGQMSVAVGYSRFSRLLARQKAEQQHQAA
jgi:hypothetical protein